MFNIFIIGIYIMLSIIISFFIALCFEIKLNGGIFSGIKLFLVFVPIINIIYVSFLSAKLYLKKKDLIKANNHIDYKGKYLMLTEALKEQNILTSEQIEDLIISKKIFNRLFN